MYDEEKRSYKIGINWGDLAIKLILLVLFIFLLIWLFPKQNLNTFYDKVFNENIQTMKNAARDYYTTARLPENIGESTKMTLQEMLNSKLILPFVDKDGKTCDTNASYVQVTKTTDNEYALKVLLSCNNQTDYIIDTIGCNNTCPSGNCNVEEEKPATPATPQKTVTQYQFKKLVKNDKVNYTCPTGYTLSGTKCYRTVESSRISATANYYDDVTTTTSASYARGETTYKYADAIISGGKTNYSCPSGYTLSGTKCYYYAKAKTSTTNGYYTCPKGGTVIGNRCEITANYITSNGSSYNATAVHSNTWKAVKTERVTYALSEYYNTYEKRVRTGTSTEYACDTCFNKVTYYTYVTSQKPITGYTCPNGGTLSGTKCITAGTKICPDGYSNLGTKCAASYDATYVNGTSTTTCPSGYTKSGNSCYLSVAAAVNTTNKTYSCPSGYTRSGSGSNTLCYKQVTVKEGSYYCSDANATLKGSTCYKTTKGSFKSYTCPKDYILDGTSCYKTTSDVKDATKKATTTSSYTYTWNKNKTLSGWTATGKTREVKA